MEAGCDAPGAEGVEEDGVGIGGFVGVVFVPEFVAGVVGVDECGELGAECLDLVVFEDFDVVDVAEVVELLDLFVGEAVLFRVGLVGFVEEVGDEFVDGGKVVGHGIFIRVSLNKLLVCF